MPLEDLYELYGYPTNRTPTSFSAGVARGADGSQDLPPLSLADVDDLERALANDPLSTLTDVQAVVGSSVTKERLVFGLRKVRHAIQRPDAHIAEVESFAMGNMARTKLPKDFKILNKTPDEWGIGIEPANTKFETERDLIGWIINCGHYWLKWKFGGPKADFRWATNDAPADTNGLAPERFVYKLAGNNADEIVVALMSDWGTGLYHSLFIAEHIAALKPDYAIHLGDVYYSGRGHEFGNYFSKPLAPILKGGAKFFTLNANHEMLSGGGAYFRFMDTMRRQFREQQQRSSYFCLRNDRFQIVGIDTAYHQDGRHKDEGLAAWLTTVLEEGEQRKIATILLSSNEPYCLESGLKTPLLWDLKDLVGRDLIDCWFWGNVHYCALYERSVKEKTNFVGSCIGHGGYPYDRKSDADKDRSPVPVRFLETEGRFEDKHNVRPDRGNNGYAVLRLKRDRTATIQYFDWKGRPRPTDAAFQLVPTKGERVLGIG